MNEHRIAVVTGVPAPYRDPIFERLARRPEVALRVFYTQREHARTGWREHSSAARRGFDHEFLSNWSPRALRRLPLVGQANLSVADKLHRFGPTFVLLYGYSQLTHWLAYRHCRAHGIPLALRGDSNVWLDTAESPTSQVRRMLVRHLVRHADAILPVGSANRKFWEKYGAWAAQFFPAPYAVDNEHIARVVGPRRDRSGLPIHFLFSGRLVCRKGVDLLLEAFNRVVESAEARLTIVGDGPERKALEAMQSDAARSQTRWLGRLTNDAAIGELADADIFVLPSRAEPWGLVVNEAMVAGVPVIAHRHCGAAIDLVEEGRTGWLFAEPTADELFAALQRSAADPARARSMGERARIKVQRWSLDRTVDAIVAAARATARGRFSRPEALPLAGAGLGHLLAKEGGMAA